MPQWYLNVELLTACWNYFKLVVLSHSSDYKLISCAIYGLLDLLEEKIWIRKIFVPRILIYRLRHFKKSLNKLSLPGICSDRLDQGFYLTSDTTHILLCRISDKLSCGEHRCEEQCHRGNCPPCWRVSFDELRCHCGAEVIYPPIPCGTQPPVCVRPCTRSMPCGHKVIIELIVNAYFAKYEYYI